MLSNIAKNICIVIRNSPAELQALAHSAEESLCLFSKAYQCRPFARVLHHTVHTHFHLQQTLCILKMIKKLTDLVIIIKNTPISSFTNIIKDPTLTSSLYKWILFVKPSILSKFLFLRSESKQKKIKENQIIYPKRKLGLDHQQPNNATHQ